MLRTGRVIQIALIGSAVFWSSIDISWAMVKDDKAKNSNSPFGQGVSQQHQKPRYAQGELIVKYKDTVTECVHCLLKNHKVFKNSTTDSSDSLDQLHAKYHVRSAKAVFRSENDEAQIHGPVTLAALKNRHADRQTSIKQKFSKRTLRAPKNANTPELSQVYVLDVPKDIDIEACAAEFARDPHVEYAEPNYLVEAQFVPNDPYFSSSGSWGQPYDDLWGIKMIKADKAWDVTDISQGQGVTVAVVDTGLDYNHPDIAANVWTNTGEIPGNGIDDDGNGFIDDTRGWDFTAMRNDPWDGHGHGTHVSGTIAAVGNNLEGIIGVAPKAKIMAVKGLNSSGVGADSDLAAALKYAADNGADIINMSWGALGTSQIIADAVNYAYSSGVVLVAASGNSYGDDVSKFGPANLPQVIAVSSLDHVNHKSDFSNIGLKIEVAAPGGDSNDGSTDFKFRNILSLRANGTNMQPNSNGTSQIVNDQYYRVRGTSMAAPHVCGVAALILARHPSLRNEDVRSVLRASADDLLDPVGDGTTYPGFDIYSGYGRINAARAIQIDTVPTSNITSVQSDTADSQLYNVRGAAAGPGFVSYDILLGSGIQPNSWLTAKTYTLPVQDNMLGQIDSHSLPSGVYTVELALHHNNGLIFRDRMQFVIAGDAFGSFPLETNPLEYDPTVASNGTTFVTAWQENQNSLLAVRVSQDGNLMIPGIQSILNIRPNFVNIACGKTECLIVFFRFQSYELYGARIANDGRILDPTGFKIDDVHDPLTCPSVGFDGTNYLVVWHDLRAGFVANNTCGKRISPGGIVLDATPIRIGESISDQIFPSLAFDGTNYLVVWEDYRNDPIANDLYGARVSPSGAVLDPEGIPLTRNPGIKRRPQITFNGTNYFLAWLDSRNILSTNAYFLYPMVMRVNTAGNALDPGGIAVSRFAAIDPYDFRPISLTTAGQDVLVVWGDYRNGSTYGSDLYAARIDNNVNVLEPDGFPVLVGSLNQKNPSVATLKNKSLIVYEDARGIFGTLIPTRNGPPAFNSIGTQAVTEGQTLNFTVSASDPDGDPITLTAPGLPPGPTFMDRHDGTAVFSWTPSFSTVAGGSASTTITLHLTASDGRLSSNQNITVQVSDVQLPGDFDFNGQVTIGEVVKVIDFFLGNPASSPGEFLIADRDNNGIVSIGEVVKAINAFLGTAPAPDIAVVDRNLDGVVDSNETNKLISDQSPVIATMSNPSVNEGQPLDFTVSASDPEGDALTYAVSPLPQGAILNQTNHPLSWTPTYTQAGPYPITVTVSDGLRPVSVPVTITVVDTPVPDLLVSALSTAATKLTPGANLVVSNSVVNQGPALAGSLTVAFHLSTNPIYGDADDIALSVTRPIASLSANGGISNASTTLTVPSTTPVGSYYVCALADSAGVIPETIETNNTRCSGSAIQVAPTDLRMSTVGFTASSANAGGSFAISNTVVNGPSATGAFTIGFRLSPNTIYGDSDDVVLSTLRSVNGLAIGASSSASTTLLVPTSTRAGSYYVCAKADSTSVILETDETNNGLCSSTQITIPQADLIISGLSTSATSVKAGYALPMANAVKNQGGSSAGSFNTVFHLSTNQIYGDPDDVASTTTRGLSALNAGAISTATTNVLVPSTTPAGSYYVCAKADAGSAITEANETNNSLCTAMPVTVQL